MRAAYLVWAFTGDNDYPVMRSVTFAGSPRTGSLAGTGGGTCWGRPSTFTYWTPVKDLVAGNGTYAVGGVTGALAEGATLVVVYASPSSPKRHVVLSVGNDVVHTFGEQMTNTFNFDPAVGGDARTTFIVGDGQTGGTGFNETALISGSAGGADISNNFDGSDGNYWDTDTYDVSGLVGAGSSSISAMIQLPTSGGDCLVWSAQVTSVAATGLPGVPTAQTFGGPCSCAGTPTGYQHLTPLPVNTATGALTESATDATLSGPGMPFVQTRSYTSLDTTPGPMGPGWTFGYNASLAVDSVTGNVTLRTDTAAQVIYTPNAGGFDPPPGVRSRLSSTAGGYRLTEPNKTTMDFDSAGHLTSIKGRTGQGLTFAYTGGLLTQVTNAANRGATLTYTAGLLTRVTLTDGRHVDYGYTGGYLTTVTDLRGKTTTYAYDAGHRLASARDPNGHYPFRNSYDQTTGRVISQLDARGNETRFDWDPATETATTTDPRGGKWVDIYAANVLLSRTDPVGHTTSYGYDQRLNPTSVTDQRGNTRTATFNGDGKILTSTAPLPLLYTESWTYNGAGDMLTHTDRRGYTTTNTYNAQGLLATSTDPLSHTSQYTYTNLGQVETLTDPRGKVTHFGYDGVGNLTSITRPSGAKTTMTYDPSGRRITVVDPRGNVSGANATDYTTTFTYDDADHAKTVTDARGGVTANTYDDAGLLTQRTDAANKTTIYGYDAANRLHTVTDPRNNVTTIEHDPDGRITSRTTPEGAQTAYDYDLAGYLSHRVDPRGNTPGATASDFTWTFTPDENGNTVASSHPNPTGGPPITTATVYDVLNRATDQTDADSFTTHTDYDGNNNITRVTDPLAEATVYDYYPDNRLHTVTDARGKVTSYDYDAAGNRTKVTDAAGGITTFGYNDDSQLASTVDPRGNTTGADATQYTWTYEYDPAGNPGKTTDPLGDVVSTSWDPNNNRSKVTDGTGDTTSWTYDPDDRVATVTGPDNAQTSYTYDANGNLASRTDSNGNATTFGYDKDNHLTTTSAPMGRVWTNTYNPDGQLTSTLTPVGAATASDPNDGIVGHSYDSLGRLTQTRVSGQTDTDFSYDQAGLLTGMTDEAGTETYSYDPADRLTSITRTGTGPGASPFAYGYGYDATGNITHRDLPHGLALDVSYDDTGRPATLTRTPTADPTSAVTLTYGYDAAGEPTTMMFPNGDTENRTYDRAGRLTKVRTTNGPGNATTGTGVTLIGQHDQVLNADGQPTSLTSTQGTNAPVTTTYRYTANRLTHYSTPDGWSADLSYDGVGNRKTLTRSGNLLNLQLPSLEINSYDNAYEQTAGYNLNGLAYDSNGNQTNDGAGDTYTYDAAGHVRTRTTSGHTTTYTYAGDGRRLTATTDTNTTRYAWDPNNALAMLTTETRPGTGAGTGTWDYLATPDGRTLRTDTTPTTGTPTTSWLHTDPIGSTTETTTPTGALAHSYTYDPFGKPQTDTTLLAGHDTNFRYSGQYLDPDTTYNLRARHYQPSQGRFTQIDPVPSAVDDAYVAAYVYANNQPANLVDPSGNCPWCVVGAIVGGIAGGVSYALTTDNFSVGGLAAAAGTGAVTGAVSAATFGLADVALGTGLGATLIGGAISSDAGLVAGSLVSGEGLPSAQDIAVSTVVGAATAGVGYGIGRALCSLRSSTTAANAAAEIGGFDLAAAEEAGGHTLARHVGMGDQALIDRNIPYASTFTDQAAAEGVTAQNLSANAGAINKWLAGSSPRLAIQNSMDSGLGRVYERATQTFVQPSGVNTVLVRTPTGYNVLTSYPTP